jgi:hypothetical protein
MMLIDERNTCIDTVVTWVYNTNEIMLEEKITYDGIKWKCIAVFHCFRHHEILLLLAQFP